MLVNVLLLLLFWKYHQKGHFSSHLFCALLISRLAPSPRYREKPEQSKQAAPNLLGTLAQSLGRSVTSAQEGFLPDARCPSAWRGGPGSGLLSLSFLYLSQSFLVKPSLLLGHPISLLYPSPEIHDSTSADPLSASQTGVCIRIT